MEVFSYGSSYTISKTNCIGIAYIYNSAIKLISLELDGVVIDEDTARVFSQCLTNNGNHAVYRIPFNNSIKVVVSSGGAHVLRYKERS